MELQKKEIRKQPDRCIWRKGEIAQQLFMSLLKIEKNETSDI